MFKQFDVCDRVLEQKQFIADEVQYNLLYRICELKASTCLKTLDETIVCAQSEGHNAWLWISKELAEDKKEHFLQELVQLLKGTALPGVSGIPMTVERFAQMYSEANNLQYFPHMMMESYSCSTLKKPMHVKGSMRRATRQHVETVAEFLAGFSEGAYRVTVDSASQMSAAEGMIETGNLYLWFVDAEPVSMANIAHRSPRQGRINAVYTPSVYRKKGYASAIVAEVCSVLESEGLAPMLYADVKNPDSNKVYKNIGFVERGKVTDIKFR